MRAMRNVKNQSPLPLTDRQAGRSRKWHFWMLCGHSQQQCKRGASALLMAQCLKWWAAQTEDVA